jgi:predicted ATPase/DNA-binding XRE family transcriptional regulator
VDLAELLATLRAARGLSQEQLAVAAGVSARAIGDLERGTTRRPQRNTIDALATALTLTEDERAALDAAARRHPPRARRPDPVPLAAALVGRDDDVAAVTALLRRARIRMVTITGPVGAGKSRLAQEVTRRAGPAFDRVGLADLSLVDDPVAAAGEIERSLDPTRSVRGTFDQIAAGVAGQSWLLVLDGVDGVAAIASDLAELLTRCPRLRLLVTGRSPLRLRAEQMWPLDRLPVGAAVDLLVERVRKVRPGFAPPSVAELEPLCELLGGVPLAIELAAIGLRTRDPAELLGQLGGGDPVAWAIDCLHGQDAVVLAVLGAFRGGVEIDVLSAVMASAGLPVERVHTSIAALVGAGLVALTDRAGRARVLMPHAAVRDAAEQRLDASDVGAAVRSAHARHYRFAAGPMTPAAERDNVRASVRWTTAHGPAALDVDTIANYLSEHASAAEAARLIARSSSA